MLVLVFSGFLIFFSSCLGAFAGFPNRNSPNAGLMGAGMIVGGVMFLAGLILGLIWLIVTVAGAFSGPPPGALFGGSPAATVPAHEHERQVLWRLRAAIGAAIIFAGGSSLLFLSPSLYSGSPREGLLLMALLLGKAPYIYALVRLARGPDRVGIAVSLAAASLQLLFWVWDAFTRLHVYLLIALLGATPIVEILVVAFAWQLGRLQAPEHDDNMILGASFGFVGAYLLLLHALFPYFASGFPR